MGKSKTPVQPTIVLRSNSDVLKYLKNHHPEKLHDFTGEKQTEIRKKRGHFKRSYEVKGVAFKNILFKDHIGDIEFIRCTFKECDFDGIWGFFFLLTKSKFIDCNFRYSRYSHIEWCWDEVSFNHCHFRNIEWDEAGLLNIEFVNCTLTNFKLNGVFPMGNVTFSDCEIEGSHFEYLNYSKEDIPVEDDDGFFDMAFGDCTIADTVFNSVELRNSLFYNSVLYKCAFIECRLAKDTIRLDKELEYSCYASLDFQTILKSDPIDAVILKKYFNISDGSDFQKVVHTMTSEIQFYTVFISYSLKDKAVAGRINKALVKRGVRTFLWEKDAPAGHGLEEIMSTGIQKHNRVLFIASEHSIKSKACQFELSETRRKQEVLWETVFFPIHIDSYLFTVQKRDIRPIAMAEEYWGNIEELRQVNSIDFSEFNKPKINNAKFEKAIGQLIRSLKIEPQTNNNQVK